MPITESSQLLTEIVQYSQVCDGYRTGKLAHGDAYGRRTSILDMT